MFLIMDYPGGDCVHYDIGSGDVSFKLWLRTMSSIINTSFFCGFMICAPFPLIIATVCTFNLSQCH